ncbi:MAG: class A beta-lactamase [Longimicrobiales bacterium]
MTNRSLAATRRTLGCLLVIALAAPPASAQTPATEAGLDRLEAEVTRLAELSGGILGLAAVHLETGRAVYHNPDVAFPMASTFKVPIAVQLLTLVDRGELSLDSLITIRPEDLHPGSGTLTQLFDDPGVILSVRNLLELMLLISDNSATDINLRLAGGASAVNARLAALDVAGVRVDRPTSLMIADLSGADLPRSGEFTIAEYRQAVAAADSLTRAQARAAFLSDERDTATPAGMADLLEQIWRGDALSPENTALLLDIMQRSTTGRARIRGMLPPYVDVAHKTGTLRGTTNDVGIIELPDGAGHVITVVYIKQSDLDGEDRERAIAHVARAVYDYFLFNPES